jgi:uncharacterized damage-inducible protein DinB
MMMDVRPTRFVISYHVRANDLIYEKAGELTDDELRREGSFDHGSAFQTIRHLVDVDYSWRELCIGHDVGNTYVWDVVPMPDLESVRAFWAEERERLLSYVGSIGSVGLDELVTFGGSTPASAPIWQVMAHVVNHGTQHRSELARFLTELGHSPGDIDLI